MFCRLWIPVVSSQMMFVFPKCECRRDPEVLPEGLHPLSAPVWWVETGHFHIEEALHAQLKLGFWEGLKSSEFNTAGLWAVTQHPRNRGHHESPQPPVLDSGLWILNRLVHSTQSTCGPPFFVCLCFLLDNSMSCLLVSYRNQQSGDCDSDTSSVCYSRILSHSEL